VRQFPDLFQALAEGRLNLSGVVLLAPHLTTGNAAELIGAAAGKTHYEIRELLAQRFPRSEELPLVEALPASAPWPNRQHAAQQVAGMLKPVGAVTDPLTPAPDPRSQVKPHAPQRFALHLVIDQATHDRLRYAQQLLSHQIPSGDVAQVVGRALEALIGQLEKRKWAATPQPRPGRGRSPASPRSIAAEVRRTVWERDGGRCTFVSETGHRCPARTLLELDHAQPLARGGRATVENLRLTCRAHNQYQAERTFGDGFMNRSGSRRGVVAAEARAREAAQEQARDVMACLRNLGCRAEEARRAIQFCETLPVTTIEERGRAALRFLGQKPGLHHRIGASGASA
jgi:hypothetical protein